MGWLRHSREKAITKRGSAFRQSWQICLISCEFAAGIEEDDVQCSALDRFDLVRQVFRKGVVPHFAGIFQYGSYTGAIDRYECSRRDDTSL